jgi:hypothetical protein
MKKDIDYINREIEFINLYIKDLISEQMDRDDRDDRDTEEDRIEDVEGRDSGEMSLDDRRDALGDAIKGCPPDCDDFDEVFTEEEQEKIDASIETVEELAQYTIAFGPYAGTTIGPRVATAYWTLKKVGKLKSPFKKKVSPDICSCYSLSRKYSPCTGAAALNRVSCRREVIAAFNSDIARLSDDEKELAEDYFKSCHDKYGLKGLYNPDVRDSAETKRGCDEFNDFLGSISSVESELTSMLSQYFRIKNQKDLTKRRSGKGSVADKLSSYKTIQIKFLEDTKPEDTGPPMDDCLSYKVDFDRGNTITFEVMSASSLNDGKTLLLKKGRNKYCLMTFDTETRGVEQNGNVKWVDPDDSYKVKCASNSWKGKIINLEV